MSLLPPEKQLKLENEFQVLHLIYNRSHNQHRVAVWWKYLNLVHRKVRNVLERMQKMQDTKSLKEKEKLKTETVELVNVIVKKQIFKKAMYEFHTIIALGQFINLGLTLVGSISAIYDLLVQIEGLGQKSSVKVERNQVEIEEDDLGEEIDISALERPKKIEKGEGNSIMSQLGQESESLLGKRNLDENESLNTSKMPISDFNMDTLFDQPKKKHKKDKKDKKDKRDKKERTDKKEKKKKKKSAMDDIFG